MGLALMALSRTLLLWKGSLTHFTWVRLHILAIVFIQQMLVK